MGTSIIKKITVKGICGTVKLQTLMKDLPDGASVGPAIPLLQIVGIARDYKVTMTDKGESLKFIGQFKATNLQTGEIFHSGACYLPGAAPDAIYGALGTQGDREVAFGFRVLAHFDESAIAKYVYDVESLMPLAENDPLALLEKTFSAPPALSAPSEQPAAAPSEQPAAPSEPVSKASAKKGAVPA